MQQRMHADQIFERLALLTVELKRFPDHTDREMAHRKDKSFPSYEAFRTMVTKSGPLFARFVEWLRFKPEFADARQILQANPPPQNGEARLKSRGKVVKGYVYLERYGKAGRH